MSGHSTQAVVCSYTRFVSLLSAKGNCWSAHSIRNSSCVGSNTRLGSWSMSTYCMHTRTDSFLSMPQCIACSRLPHNVLHLPSYQTTPTQGVLRMFMGRWARPTTEDCPEELFLRPGNMCIWVASFPGLHPGSRRLQYGKVGEGLVHFITWMMSRVERLQLCVGVLGHGTARTSQLTTRT